MKIGNVELNGNVILGPMAGITHLAYREFMKPFGVALSYSEMISDCGISYGNARTFEYLQTSEMDSPVGLQIFGFSLENSAKAIEIIEKTAKYDILDVNLGCPVPKVVKTGAGSAWLKDVPALREYMSGICRASTKPVTAKIRLGWSKDSINVEEVALMLQEVGVAAIAIHCRTREEFYAGKADYEAIRGLKEKLHIPLIVSGDIFTLEDAIRAKEITNCDGIMVARGARGNPFLITQIDHYFKTGERLPGPDLKTQIGYMREFVSKVVAFRGEEKAIREMRGLLTHFLSGYPGMKKYYPALVQAQHEKDIEAVLRGIEVQFGL